MREELYALANHIASAKNGLPEGWADWAEEIESDLRRLVEKSADYRPALKEHEVRETVNALRDIAKEFHGSESLRDRIARCVADKLKGERSHF